LHHGAIAERDMFVSS